MLLEAYIYFFIKDTQRQKYNSEEKIIIFRVKDKIYRCHILIYYNVT